MHKSGYYDLRVGTSQGSVLGPLLFFIFVNDLYLMQTIVTAFYLLMILPFL